MSTTSSAPVSMKAYRISRAPGATAGQPQDQFAKLNFEPPLESDELFDALRVSYPTLKTHTERKKQAVLDFLMEERQAIECEISAFVEQIETPAPADTPEGTKGSTPYSQYSFVDHRTSSSSSASASSQSAGSSPEVPALKDMTSVWIAAPHAHPKIHTRRTMTSQEKEEYRQRRKMKACKECRVRKRKCTHNHSPGVSKRAQDPASSVSRVKHKSHKQTQDPPPAVHSADKINDIISESVWTGSDTMTTPFDFSEYSPNDGLFGDFPLFPDDILSQDTMAFSAGPEIWTNTGDDFMSQYLDPLAHTQSFQMNYTPSSQTSPQSSRSAQAGSVPSATLASPSQPLISEPVLASSHATFMSDWNLDLASSSLVLPTESSDHQSNEFGPCREERSWNSSTAHHQHSPQDTLQPIGIPRHNSNSSHAGLGHTSTGSSGVSPVQHAPTRTLQSLPAASGQGTGHEPVIHDGNLQSIPQIATSASGKTHQRFGGHSGLPGSQLLAEQPFVLFNGRNAQSAANTDVAPAHAAGSLPSAVTASGTDTSKRARSSGPGAHDRRGLHDGLSSDGSSTCLVGGSSSVLSSRQTQTGTRGTAGLPTFVGTLATSQTQTGAGDGPLQASLAGSSAVSPRISTGDLQRLSSTGGRTDASRSSAGDVALQASFAGSLAAASIISTGDLQHSLSSTGRRTDASRASAGDLAPQASLGGSIAALGISTGDRQHSPSSTGRRPDASRASAGDLAPQASFAGSLATASRISTGDQRNLSFSTGMAELLLTGAAAILSVLFTLVATVALSFCSGSWPSGRVQSGLSGLGRYCQRRGKKAMACDGRAGCVVLGNFGRRALSLTAAA